MALGLPSRGGKPRVRYRFMGNESGLTRKRCGYEPKTLATPFDISIEGELGGQNILHHGKRLRVTNCDINILERNHAGRTFFT